MNKYVALRWCSELTNYTRGSIENWRITMLGFALLEIYDFIIEIHPFHSKLIEKIEGLLPKTVEEIWSKNTY